MLSVEELARKVKMEITRKGTPPSERVWRGSCTNCGSEAKAKQSEMKNISHDQREGGFFSWEKCPVCGFGDNATGYGGMLFYPIKSEQYR